MTEETPEKIAYGGILTLITIVLILIVALNVIGVVTLYDVANQDDCPDCNLICPDIPDCERYIIDETEFPWKDQLDPEINGTNIGFTYYDNYEEKLKLSPTFTPENWTDLPDWTMDQHAETFTQNQKSEIMLLMMNLAYYKETGTWLGE